MSTGDGITYREIEEGDFASIKALHVECFPVQYEDAFFRNACRGVGVRDAPLVSVVAVDCESSSVVGCILAQFNPVARIDDKHLFADSAEPPVDALYILTLGLTRAYRRSGLGTHLLQRCTDRARANARCGAVYLHVIHYNESAIRFYEKNDFVYLRTLDEFYTIDQTHYTAYLYILYVNGHRAPLLSRVLLNARATAKQSLTFLYTWVATALMRIASDGAAGAAKLPRGAQDSFPPNYRKEGVVATPMMG